MKKIGFILTALVLSAGISYAAPNYNAQQNSEIPLYQQNYYPTQTLNGNKTLKGSVVTVPAGQSMPVVVTTPISSANMTTGQTVTVALGSETLLRRQEALLQAQQLKFLKQNMAA